jgi:hypothetical protein
VDSPTWLALLAPIGLSYGFLIVVGLLDESPLGWMSRFGWDSGVFSFGLMPGIFSNTKVAEYYGDSAVLAGAACLLVSFLSVALILRIRKRESYRGLRRISEAGMGSISLAPPIYFHAHAYGISLLALIKQLV